MRTSLNINTVLLQEVLAVSDLKTKMQVINKALEVYLNQLAKRELAGLRGKIKWDGDLNSMRQG